MTSSTITRLKHKRVVLPTLAAVAVLGAGGVVWASTASADLSGDERDRVGAAAVEAVGGGTVVDAETSDDKGEAYEVEVRQDDGTEVEVTLDEDLGVVRQDVDDDTDRDDADDRNDSDERDDRDDADADDRALTAEETQQAERAAVGAVGGGTVTDVEASDDAGVAYEVDVRADDGSDWDVELDADFVVVTKAEDR